MLSLHTVAVDYHEDSDFYFRRLCHLPGMTWLDSGKQRFYNSRYDILTALPREQITATDQGCHVQRADDGAQTLAVDALDYLATRLDEQGLDPASLAAAEELPFIGGAIGYLAYEALHDHFGLKRQQNEMPNACFAIYDWALIQDHHEHTAFLCFLDTCDHSFIELICRTLDSEPTNLPDFQCSPLLPSITPEEYLNAVERIKDYIRAGDCYQVNFTQRFAGPFSGSTASAYLRLRNALPSPFSAYLDTPTGAILSLSPERFVELKDRCIRTQPIKGTAPRGGSTEEDVALAEELQHSEKNRAENLMIVDLLRNDFSKVSEAFSVRVPELFGLQSFANVHHLVSTVTGTLREDFNRLDLLKACFPGGSITGAPKKRAMEIIDELENHQRSVYCGSILYLSLNGRMDSSIAIRTLVQRGSNIYCWGGGGIVADSDPAMEYQESLHKIGLLLETLQKP